MEQEMHGEDVASLPPIEPVGLIGLARFMQAARTTPSLSPDAQKELIGRVAAGDPANAQETANTIATSQFLNMAVAYAKKFRRNNPDVPLDDLVGAANESLLRAVYNFAKVP